MDNGFLTTSRKRSVIIEVIEVSPFLSDQDSLLSEQVAVVEEADGSDVSGVLVKGHTCNRSLQAVDMKEAGSLPASACVPENNVSIQSISSCTSKEGGREDKQVKMLLPSFSALGIDSLKTPGRPQHQQLGDDSADLVPAPPSVGQVSNSGDFKLGVVPPPTPPPDDVAFFKWHPIAISNKAIETISASLHQTAPTSQRASQSNSSQNTSNRPPSIPLPPYEDIASHDRQPSTWLDRAVETIVSSRGDMVRERQLQMVVQALPSQAKASGTKPVFQQVAEILQQQETDAPYITITHAVSQVVSMEEIPASPPATPNNLNTSDDYFDNQTIFTHAAVVPNYHTLASSPLPVTSRANGIITAPASTHVSTLERYIPPTTPQEVQDFFSISRRSYLVDRLTELSPNNGTLLLVYPTAIGATTFARSYIGPVIDPFLRRFCLLNNLTIDAAARLGKMAALAGMKDFETMGASLKALCENLIQRAPAGREPKSGYHVIHAEPVSITIERSTWIEWFIEQETNRLRKDMIDYQQAGGRLPARGFDASPGSLAREVIEGIKNSKEHAGGVGIEVGVFVIRRSIL